MNTIFIPLPKSCSYFLSTDKLKPFSTHAIAIMILLHIGQLH